MINIPQPENDENRKKTQNARLTEYFTHVHSYGTELEKQPSQEPKRPRFLDTKKLSKLLIFYLSFFIHNMEARNKLQRNNKELLPHIIFYHTLRYSFANCLEQCHVFNLASYVTQLSCKYTSSQSRHYELSCNC